MKNDSQAAELAPETAKQRDELKAEMKLLADMAEQARAFATVADAKLFSTIEARARAAIARATGRAKT